MKNEVGICNISRNGYFVLPAQWYKTIRLDNLVNHNTNLSEIWLRTLEHNSFQICRKLSESKILTTIYLIYQ